MKQIPQSKIISTHSLAFYVFNPIYSFPEDCGRYKHFFLDNAIEVETRS